ncbi:hypothetical protein, partial [Leucobacter sp. M11]|uniref:hypothetical protein n=1 Tax=Leucobacter sp. M11 TaxID=2993565 RepID=UPI002D8096EB
DPPSTAPTSPGASALPSGGPGPGESLAESGTPTGAAAPLWALGITLGLGGAILLARRARPGR